MNASAKVRWPVLGVVYLAPSPGYPGHPGMREYEEDALEQVHTLLKCGADGVLLENENDRPYTLTASLEVVAGMTAVARRVRQAYPELYLGVEFLLNDPCASLSIAASAGADFIRTDYWVDEMTRAEYGGAMKIDSVAVLAHRRRIRAESVEIYADLQVKYAEMVRPRPLAESATQALAQSAHAVVVSGPATGQAIEAQALQELRRSHPRAQIYLGSGLTPELFGALLPWCDGALVGSALMRSGRIELERAQDFFQQLREFRQSYGPQEMR